MCLWVYSERDTSLIKRNSLGGWIIYQLWRSLCLSSATFCICEKGLCLHPRSSYGKQLPRLSAGLLVVSIQGHAVTLSHCFIYFLYVCLPKRVWFPSIIRFSSICNPIHKLFGISSDFPGAGEKQIWILHATFVFGYFTYYLHQNSPARW